MKNNTYLPIILLLISGIINAQSSDCQARIDKLNQISQNLNHSIQQMDEYADSYSASRQQIQDAHDANVVMTGSALAASGIVAVYNPALGGTMVTGATARAIIIEAGLDIASHLLDLQEIELKGDIQVQNSQINRINQNINRATRTACGSRSGGSGDGRRGSGGTGTGSGGTIGVDVGTEPGLPDGVGPSDPDPDDDQSEGVGELIGECFPEGPGQVECKK